MAAAENLRDQMERLKLRFKDVIYRPIVLLREIQTRGGRVTPAGAATVAYGHHQGRLNCDCARGVSTRDVTLIGADLIDKRLNLADAAKKHDQEWFRGRKIRVIRPREGIERGEVLTIKEASGRSAYFSGEVVCVCAIHSGAWVSMSLDEAELAELPEDRANTEGPADGR